MEIMTLLKTLSKQCGSLWRIDFWPYRSIWTL